MEVPNSLASCKYDLCGCSDESGDDGAVKLGLLQFFINLVPLFDYNYERDSWETN
jgi:hypothetical protein